MLWASALVPLRAQSPGGRLKVSIVALTDFDQKDLQEEDLINSIKEARDGLANFFKTNYGVTAAILTTKDETKADFLRTWLFRDLGTDTGADVQLIFVLTHGFAIRNPDPSAFNNEIFLATSDTDPADFYGKAIRGSELIEAFRKMPKRPVIFLFVDSCGAGAIDGDNLQKTLQHEPEFSSRLMILAGSMPNQDAYRARFTKALVKLWQNPVPACHSGRRQIEKFLTETVKSIPGVSPDVKQNVRLVAPLGQDFCVESFNYTERLAFVFNAAPDDVTLSFQASDSADQEPQIDIRPSELIPVALRPKSYTMVAQRNNPNSDNSSQVESIDLKNDPVSVKIVFKNDKLDDADAQEKAANYLDSRRLHLDIANALRTSADGVRTEVQTEISANRAQLEKGETDASATLVAAEMRMVDSKSAIEAATAERHEILKGIPQDCQLCAVALPPEALQRLKNVKYSFDAAEAQYKSAEEQDRYARTELQALNQAMAQLHARSVRLELLRQQAELTDLVKTLEQSTAKSLAEQLQKTFPGTKITDRGIVVPLPNNDEKNSKHTEDYQALVAILNHQSLHVELELLTRQAASSLGQVRARGRILAFLTFLQQLGLTAQAGARAEMPAGTAPSKQSRTTIQLVLSDNHN